MSKSKLLLAVSVLQLSVSSAHAGNVNRDIVDCGGTAAALRETLLTEAEKGNDSARRAATVAGGIMFEALWIIAEDTSCKTDITSIAQKMYRSGSQQVREIGRKISVKDDFDSMFEALTTRLDECRERIGADRFEKMRPIARKVGLPCGGS